MARLGGPTRARSRRHGVAALAFDRASRARAYQRLALRFPELCARARNLLDARPVERRKRPTHADAETEASADRRALCARNPHALRRTPRAGVMALKA